MAESKGYERLNDQEIDQNEAGEAADPKYGTFSKDPHGMQVV